jgi:hypothetical protein
MRVLFKKPLSIVFTIILSFSLSLSFAQHSSHHSYHSSQKSSVHSSSYHFSGGHHRSTYSTSAKRDSHGHIARSSKAREQFMKQTGYPHGRPGYVIDHKVALSEGGTDDPSNMQWQTKASAKEKDKWERGQHTSTKKHEH